MSDDRRDDDFRDTPSNTWQKYAAMVAVVGFIVAAVWGEAQNASTIASHTTYIQALQATQQNMQVMLSSQNTQLATLTQEIADMKQGGHQ